MHIQNYVTMHSAANSFSREITRHFDSYFEEYDLATSYIELLLIVYDQIELSQNDLAEKMNLAPSTITRFIKKLLKMDLIQKKKEGRTAIIELSANGRSLAPKINKLYETAVSDLENMLGEKYVHTTKELLLHGANLLRDKS